jgi:dUTPase
MNSKKLKGIVTTKLPKKLDIDDAFEISLEVKADSSEFVPVVRSDGGFDLFANASIDVHGVARHTITSRVIQQIDCGVNIGIPKGYRLVLEPQPEHISKGLIIQSAIAGEGKQRIVLFAHNLGKEILVFNKGDKIARMYLTNNYTAKLKVN